MGILLSPDVEQLIAEKVRSGRYNSADEVVREGMGLLDLREKPIAPPPLATIADVVAVIQKIAGEVPESEWEKVPTDLSKNVDHYLYGARKSS